MSGWSFWLHSGWLWSVCWQSCFLKMARTHFSAQCCLCARSLFLHWQQAEFKEDWKWKTGRTCWKKAIHGRWLLRWPSLPLSLLWLWPFIIWQIYSLSKGRKYWYGQCDCSLYAGIYDYSGIWYSGRHACVVHRHKYRIAGRAVFHGFDESCKLILRPELHLVSVFLSHAPALWQGFSFKPYYLFSAKKLINRHIHFLNFFITAEFSNGTIVLKALCATVFLHGIHPGKVRLANSTFWNSLIMMDNLFSCPPEDLITIVKNQKRIGAAGQFFPTYPAMKPLNDGFLRHVKSIWVAS